MREAWWLGCMDRDRPAERPSRAGLRGLREHMPYNRKPTGVAHEITAAQHEEHGRRVAQAVRYSGVPREHSRSESETNVLFTGQLFRVLSSSSRF